MSIALIAPTYAEITRAYRHFLLLNGSPVALEYLLSTSPAPTGPELQSWLSTPGNLAAFQQLISAPSGAAAMCASGTAMNAVAASSTALNAVVSSSTAMNAVIASSTALNAVVSSSTAMAAVVASSTAMTAVFASWPARTALWQSDVAVTRLLQEPARSWLLANVVTTNSAATGSSWKTITAKKSLLIEAGSSYDSFMFRTKKAGGNTTVYAASGGASVTQIWPVNLAMSSIDVTLTSGSSSTVQVRFVVMEA